MAVAVQQQGRLADPDKLRGTWKERIKQAREHRKPLEKIWLSNLAFAAGQHWLVWDERQRQLRHIQEIDPRYGEVDLYTADRITEFRRAQLGELGTDDDRPELLAAQSGEAAEEVERELNQAVGHAWEHEWKADEALRRTRRLCYDLGTAAIRVRRDQTVGPVTTKVPLDASGQPALDEATKAHLEQHGTLPDGSLPKFKEIREGRTVLESLSALNLLTPAGVTHEDLFPWEVIVRPTAVETVLAQFPDAVGLTEDNDIASVIGLSTADAPRQSTDRGRLRGHVWLYTCFERPCPAHPNGRVVVLAGRDYTLLDVREELDYQGCDGEYRTGIHYFHWDRLNDRFWSRSGIEPLKDPQRLINRRETQNAEIIDRGMPKVFVAEGSIANNPSGLPLETIEMKPDAKPPDFHQGVGPGPWMYEDIAHHAENMAHASTLSPLRLGENPANVQTYSQLALLNENEGLKRSDIIQGHKSSTAGFVEDGVHDIRRYWPEQKTIYVSGEDDRIASATFQKSRIPDFYLVKVAKGSPKPRSQGAELKKIEAIWLAAVQSGVVQDPQWIQWYSESLEAGQAQELPHVEVESTVRLAHFENFLMQQGETVVPADYDPPGVHLPIHREAQDQARAAGDTEGFVRIQQHIDATVQVQAQNAQKAAAIAQASSPLGSIAPPQPGQLPAQPPI